MNSLLGKAITRTALIGSSLLQRNSFWAQAALGRNQMFMHEFGDGAISIGKVSEQLYSEGFLGSWHRVLTRELGPEKAKHALSEVGTEGAAWEIQEAIAHGIWVPTFLGPWVGKPDLYRRVQSSWLWRTLVSECMHLLFRMIMAEGGWGVVEEVEIGSDPMFIRVRNTAESRQLGPSDEPTCHVASGIFRAYIQELLGVTVQVRETTCSSMGDRCCTFEYSGATHRS